MARTIRNKYDIYLTYEKLMEAHNKCKKGKGLRKEVIQFELKKEEYIKWIYEQLKNGTYRHSGYRTFYVTQPKLRKVEASTYIDRIVDRWIVDNFLEEYFIKTYINTSYACIKDKGMHKAAKDVQNTMKHCKRIWGKYYILKMDVRKYFANVRKDILIKILQRKIKDKKLMWLIKTILYSKNENIGLQIRKLYFTNIWKYLFE